MHSCIHLIKKNKFKADIMRYYYNLNELFSIFNILKIIYLVKWQ